MRRRFGAAVLRGYGSRFAVEEVILDAGPAEGEILVRIAGCGMCRTDLAVRRSAGRTPLPAVLGHEGAGVVVETGGTGTGLSAGDHVVLSFDSCGHCRNCMGAAPAYCDSFAPLNLFGGRRENAARFTDAAGGVLAPRWFGQSSFAEYAMVPARNAVRVDPSLPIELLGPLGCGFLTGAGSVFNSFGVGPGDTVAVFGAGAVGLAAVMAATAAGAVAVAVDRHPERLAHAERLHAIPLHAASAGLPHRIQQLTDGGAQYALDTTGSAELINDALVALRPRGHLGLVARLPATLPIQPGALDRGRTISHICEGDAVPALLVPKLTALWRAGRFPFDELIRTYPLSDINEAERDCEAGRVVKPVLIPEGGGR
ncbi:NAD(P)-dependent alcohol dehydrogenase [Streptomyces sp. NPDC056796]|uniref:NAD(P)-dependent alcohol dehydrogenase n=1 Tax=Streptomyces sp. NPDC056796 TaxID=3345947 RepID=UPI0036BE15BB